MSNAASKKGEALESLMLIAGLGLFMGAAVLAGAVALTWQPRHTDSLISVTAAVCGGGFVMFALVIGLVIGIAFFKRLNDGRANEPAGIYQPAIPGTWQESQPPALTDAGKEGAWMGGGPTSYDLWDEEPQSEARQWAEVNA